MFLIDVSRFLQKITKSYNITRAVLSSVIEDIPIIFQLVRILWLATHAIHTKHVGFEIYQHLHNVFLLNFDVNTLPRLYAVILHRYVVHLDYCQSDRAYRYLCETMCKILFNERKYWHQHQPWRIRYIYIVHNHNSLITDSLRSIVNSFGYLLASLPTSKKKATNQVTNTVSNNRPFSKYFDIRHEMLGWVFVGRFYLYREKLFVQNLLN